MYKCYLIGKRIFVDIIKLKILKIGDYTRLSECHHKCSWRGKGANTDKGDHRGNNWSDATINQGIPASHQNLEEAKTDFSWSLQRECGHIDTLIQSSVFQNCQNTFLLF
jgi:hypothetical protein